MTFQISPPQPLSGSEVFTDRDIFWMQQAIQLARRAALHDEVPVGALVILNDQLIGEGLNSSIANHDPTGHAEIIALRHAAKRIGNYRLIKAKLYVTLEPCIMCIGAMIHARIERLIYGAHDSKTGAVKSRIQLLDQSFLNHRVKYSGGLLVDECGALLTEFFKINLSN